MSENQTYQITREFELPIGYTDEAGKLHKAIVMRRLKNGDIISLQKDVRMKELKQNNFNIISGNMAETMLANAVVREVNNILFGLVITRIGDIAPEKINRQLFVGFWDPDIECILKNFNELNGYDKGGAEDKKPPFDQ